MKKQNILFILTIVGIFSVLVFSVSSCRKPDKPRAVITVYDTSGYTIEGAFVKIYVDKNGAYINPKDSTLEFTDYTNESGEIVYESDLEGIRDVFVSMGPDSINYFEERTGEGVLVLKADQVYYEEITIR
jgi:hypothetical protein